MESVLLVEGAISGILNSLPKDNNKIDISEKNKKRESILFLKLEKNNKFFLI